ncbi:MAG TPA: hypothetical protein VGS58_16280 [Candidatus Sulfopaludibacter sp.]|nr:hypothetical protein [Candidatus Sulfopaludibacter sp.]
MVQGDRDPFHPVELSIGMARAIPRSSLWIVPDAGHGPVNGGALARIPEDRCRLPAQLAEVFSRAPTSRSDALREYRLRTVNDFPAA